MGIALCYNATTVTLTTTVTKRALEMMVSYYGYYDQTQKDVSMVAGGAISALSHPAAEVWQEIDRRVCSPDDVLHHHLRNW